MKNIIIILSLLFLAGCSLLRDALDTSHRQKAQLAEGDVIRGDGFALRVPESGLYPKRDFPLCGGVTLRPVEQLEDGKAYYVTPFVSSSAQNPDQALQEWNSNPQKKGFRVDVFKKTETSFSGSPAIEATMDITAKDQSRGQIACLLVVQRSSGFLILASGNIYRPMDDKDRVIQYCQRDLQRLVLSVMIEEGQPVK